LTSITIPDSVTAIQGYTFNGCDELASATIGDSVTAIRTKAFYDCGSLESINIPDSVTTIEKYAFYKCVLLKTITIPDSVTTIGGTIKEVFGDTEVNVKQNGTNFLFTDDDEDNKAVENGWTFGNGMWNRAVFDAS